MAFVLAMLVFIVSVGIMSVTVPWWVAWWITGQSGSQTLRNLAIGSTIVALAAAIVMIEKASTNSIP